MRLHSKIVCCVSCICFVVSGFRLRRRDGGENEADMSDVLKLAKKAREAGEIYAKESIFLGKKCYLDVLESTDKDGQKLTGFHIRMKGVSTRSIHHAAAREAISIIELYKRLYRGLAITFDLTCGGTMCGFKYNPDLSVRSYLGGEFSRTLAFRKGGQEDPETDIDEED